MKLGDLVYSKLIDLGFSIPMCRGCQIWKASMNEGGRSCEGIKPLILGHFKRKLRELNLPYDPKAIEIFLDQCLSECDE